MTGLTVGTRVAAVFTHVEFSGNECCGYCQLCDSATVDDLAEKVEISAGKAPYVSSLNRGDIVLALYSEDGVWYRARIESMDGSVASVFFIDYGNKEKINNSDIKVAVDELQTIQGLATKCELVDILPNGNTWTDSETEQLHAQLVGFEFTVEVLGSSRSTSQNGVALRLYSDTGLFKHGKEQTTKSKSTKSSSVIELQIGMQYNAYLSYVDSANKFWIQLVDREHELNDLMTSLADSAAGGAEKLDYVSAGKLCMAFYSEDQAPYRSSILTVNGNTSLVQFVDYGNSESKDVSELLKLPQHFQGLPAMSIKCCYKRTKVDNNTLEEKLQELTESDGVLVRVLGRTDDVYNVEIDKIENISSTSASPQVNGQHFIPMELDSTKVYDVCLSCVEHPGKFFIQLLENGPELDQVMVRLTREFNSNTSAPSLSAGTACIGQLSDDQHYRCVIQAVSGENAQVHTVDFGFNENITVNRLRAMSPIFLDVPCYATECTVDVTKTQDKFWSRTEIDTLKGFESKVSLVAKVTTRRSNLYQLDLYDTRDRDEDRYVNAEMLGVGKSAQKAHTIKMETRRAEPSAAANTAVPIPPPEVATGSQELICVTAVKAPNIVYGQLTKTDAKKIESLQIKLNEKYDHMTAGEMILSDSSVGVSCTTRYSDGGWYRALITQKRGNSVSIAFADFGDETITQSLELKQMLPEFGILSQQCILCHFPRASPSNSKEMTEKLLLNKVIEVKLITKKDGVYPMYEVELTSNIRNQGLAGKLEGSSMGSKQPPRLPKSVAVNKEARVKTLNRGDGYSFLQVDSGCSEEVMVTHVVDPQHFHVQVTSMAKQLDTMMDKLQAHYASITDMEETLLSPYLGQPCIAKYTDDNSWYRAKVSGLLNNGRAEVTFVDYGNTECLQRETLKIASQEFMELPAQAIFCGLSGVKATQGFWSPEHIAQFEDIALDQNFTAVFQDYSGEAEDLYTVKLENQAGEDINLKYGTSTNSICSEQPGRKVAFGKGIDMRIEVQQDNEWIDHAGNDSQRSEGNRFGGRSGERGGSRGFSGGDRSGGSGFGGGDRSGGFGSGNRSGGNNQNHNATEERGFGNRSRDGNRGGGFGGQNRDEDRGGGGRSNDRGGGFGGQNRGDQDRGSGFGGRSNDRGGGFGGQNRDQDRRGGFGGRSNDRGGGFGGQSRDQERGGGFGGQNRDQDRGGGFGGRSNDRGGGFGGQNRDQDRGSGFGGRSNDRGGGFGGQNRDQERGSGFGGRSNDRGGGFGGQNRDQDRGGGFGGRSNDRGGGGFGGQNRDQERGGFGGRSNDRGSGFSGGGFGQSQQTTPANDEWDTDVSTVVPEKPASTSAAPKSRFRGTSQTINTPSSLSSDQKSDAWSRRVGSVTFTSQKLVADTSCQVFVVYTNSPGEFWCQLADKASELQSMMDQMNEHYNSLSPTKSSIDQPEIGMPCVAKYSEDKRWYRAEISSFDDKKLEVQFIDYGNSEFVDLKSVKLIQKEFTSFPLQAIRCCLSGVKCSESKWSDKAIESFETLTADKELVCAVKSQVGGSYLVNLEDASGELDVALKLHEAGHCTLAPVGSGKLQKVVTKVPYPALPIGIGAKMEVYVSWIEDPSMFWVQPVENQTILEELADQVQEEYTTGPSADKRVSKISEGMAVIAKFSEDEVWYRAVVESEGKTASVRFIDYGNTDSVAVDSLRMPSASLMEVPAQAIYCSLADVKPLQPGSWNVDAKDIMESMVKEAVSCTFKETMPNGFSVDIVSNGIGVAEELVSAAVVKKISLESMTKPESPPKDVRISPGRSEAAVSQGSVKQSVKQRLNFAKNVTLDSGSVESAYISQVNSISHFYIQLAKLAAQLEVLMEKLDKTCGAKSRPSMIVPGMACAAKFSGDEMWYRATVVEVNADDADVLFIDYGNSEVVSFDNICEISQDCLSLPPQAIQCSLKNCNEIADDSAVDKFTDMTMDKEVQVYVINAGSPTVVDISVDDTKSLSDLLNSKSSASTSSASVGKTLPAQIIPTDPNTKVFTSYVHSPSMLYLQLASQETNLNDLSTKLQAAYSANVCDISVEDLKKGYLCCTMYVEDNLWYRAEVEEVCGDKCHVLFVDYGNSEEVETSSLKVLTPEFMTQPAMGFRCALEGVVPIKEKWSEEANSHLESLVMDQELTCKFVSNTTVSLRSEDGDVGEDLVAQGHAKLVKAEELKFSEQGKPEGQVTTFVSHVEDVFYIQLSTDEDKLAELSENLQTLCEQHNTPQPEQITEGLHCCAKFSEDQAWYRATVSKVTGQKFTVRFLDYGNCDIVTCEQLKLLSEKLLTPELLAYPAVIKGVGRMTEEQQKLFSSLTEDQELTTDFLEMTDDGLNQVTLTTSEGKDIGQEFWTEEATDGTETSANECGDASSTETTDDLGKLTNIVLEEGDRVQVTCSHINSPSSFYVHLDRNKDTLNSLCDEMFKLYSEYEGNDLKMESPKEGQVCAVQYSEDESWYRAKVLEVLGSDKFKVEFLDHGNIEECSGDMIRKLLTRFVDLPVQTMLCTLGGVRSVDGPWSEEALELFSKLLGEKSLLADIMCVSDDNAYIVQLFDMGILLSQKFIDEGYGVEASTPTYVSKKTKRVFSDSTPLKVLDLSADISEDSEDDRYPSLELNQSMDCNCCVSHAVSPGKFWLQLSEKQEDLQKFMDGMQEKYSKEKPLTLEQIKCGSPCVSRYSEDGRWYRASVMDKYDTNVLVIFVDYGNSETVTPSELREIQSEDMLFPRQAFCCRMKGIIPEAESEGWEKIACSRLEELTFEKDLKVKLCKALPNSCYEVEMSDGDVCLTDTLVQGGYARFSEGDNKVTVEKEQIASDDSKDDEDFHSIKSDSVDMLDLGPFKPLKVNKDESYTAAIMNIKSPGCFYILLEEPGSEKRAELVTSIKQYVFDHSDEVLSSDEIIKGTGCLARMDDGFYGRAVITETNDQNVEVYMIDVGLHHCVDSAFLKPIPNDMLDLPAQAITCSLADIQPIEGDGWSEDSISGFQALSSEYDLVSLYVDPLTKHDGPPYNVTINAIGAKEQEMLNMQMVELGFADFIPGSTLESEALMDETEVSFNELSLLKENSIGSDDETTDIDTSKMTMEESVLETTGASDSFSFLSGTQLNKIREKNKEETDDEFYDAEEKENESKEIQSNIDELDVDGSTVESKVDDIDTPEEKDSVKEEETVNEESTNNKAEEKDETNSDENVAEENANTSDEEKTEKESENTIEEKEEEGDAIKKSVTEDLQNLSLVDNREKDDNKDNSDEGVEENDEDDKDHSDEGVEENNDKKDQSDDGVEENDEDNKDNSDDGIEENDEDNNDHSDDGVEENDEETAELESTTETVTAEEQPGEELQKAAVIDTETVESSEETSKENFSEDRANKSREDENSGSGHTGDQEQAVETDNDDEKTNTGTSKKSEPRKEKDAESDSDITITKEHGAGGDSKEKSCKAESSGELTQQEES
ncbi:uncharacterized protein LOC117325879 [Pecten maximus]|uniref:uncharacterized protein LOC117325879 n=1 Tax=Pecten maximus TaxID=6579 RepID=UPI001458AFD7|nr:uncharacterized protein LOC117325879 [Pecten maximus]